jgi:hypothetical protein
MVAMTPQAGRAEEDNPALTGLFAMNVPCDIVETLAAGRRRAAFHSPPHAH